MNLHALSTKIPPTLRTFLLLWHNVLPIITLDCLISGEIERYTAKESVIGLCYHVVLFSSLDLSRSFTLSSIYLALSTQSLALLLALSSESNLTRSIPLDHSKLGSERGKLGFN